MKIADIIIGERQRKALGDIPGLAASIASVGLLQPPVVRPDNTLVAGFRRLTACKRLGWDAIPVYVAQTLEDELRMLQAERDENTCRKDYVPSEAVAIGEKLEPMERKAAKERQREHGNTAPGRPANTSSNLDEVLRADQRVAEAVGMRKDTYRKAKEIVESGDDALIAQMDKSGKVSGAYNKLKEQQYRERLRDVQPLGVFPVKLIEGDMLTDIPESEQFSCVVADPPYNVTAYDWDQWQSLQEFMDKAEAWLLRIKILLAERYHLFWFCAPRFSADMEMLFRRLELPVISRIVWSRPSMPHGSHASNKFVDTWEMIFHSGNHALNFPSDWTDAWFDVQRHATPLTTYTGTERRAHPTQKPGELIRRLVAFGSFPGERVIDPFAGSGITGAVCPEDRECWLVERDHEYAGVIRTRLGIA